MANQCDQEMCPMWDGDTCPCERFGLDRDDLPSQAVIEAVEQAESRHRYLTHGECSCGYLSLDYEGWRSHHRRFEVARAAEAAALGAIAGDWLIERTYGLSDEGIKGWPEINANAYRCAIEDAQSALRERADELTDTDDRGK